MHDQYHENHHRAYGKKNVKRPPWRGTPFRPTNVRLGAPPFTTQFFRAKPKAAAGAVEPAYVSAEAKYQ